MKRFIFFAAVFAGQPFCGIFLASVFFHIPNNRTFAFNVTVPCLQSSINIRLSQFSFLCGNRFFYCGSICLQLVKRIYISAAVCIGTYGYGITLTQFFCALFQTVRRNTAHIDTSDVRKIAACQIQIELFGGNFCILAIHLKEITNLIQNNGIGVVMLDGVIRIANSF